MQPDEILLVEDNPGDVALTTTALDEAGFVGKIHVATNGDDAVELLLGRRAYDRLPDLVLLDLNLPRRDGRSVLREIRTDPHAHDVPVIILTSSELDRDLCRPGSGADDYFVKPESFHGFVEVAAAILASWERAVRERGAVR
jgi:two-component system, chemotaxis family, response regulator Rcp1